MRSSLSVVLSLLVAGTVVLVQPAGANEAGDWLLRVGVGTVDPKSSNGDVAKVESATTLTFNGTYMWNQNLGIEILASLPFNHDIKLRSDGSKVGETKHLPPTVSVQYHFMPGQTFNPYVGLGINYTLFFDESTTGALTGVDLKLDDSFGAAAQIGFDYSLSDNMFVNAEARWIDIDTDAELDGAALETVEIDPLVFGINLGWKF